MTYFLTILISSILFSTGIGIMLYNLVMGDVRIASIGLVMMMLGFGIGSGTEHCKTPYKNERACLERK